jgi:hypothetical protein
MAPGAASSLDPNSLINAGTAILVAFVSASVALVVAILQARAHKKEQKTAAETWQAHAEELRERMAVQYESQIDYLRRELRREQQSHRRAERTELDETR